MSGGGGFGGGESSSGGGFGGTSGGGGNSGLFSTCSCIQQIILLCSNSKYHVVLIISDQSNVAADKNTSLTKGVADKIRGHGTRSVLLKQNINVNKFAYNSSYDQSQVDSNKKFCYVRRGVVVKQGEKPIGFFIT